MSNPINFEDTLTELVNKEVFPQVINRIFLYGPPGTGKSTVGTTLFGPKNVERVIVSGKTPIEDLLGMMTLDETGALKWVDGPAVRAMRHGKCLVIDEMGDESPALRTTLHALLDNPAAITLPNGDRVTAKKGYCVIATSNRSPADIAEALIDRCELVIPCIVPSTGLARKLSKKSQGILENVTKRRIEDTAESFKWARPITPRLLIAIDSLMERGLNIEEVARLVFADQAQQTDLMSLYA